MAWENGKLERTLRIVKFTGEGGKKKYVLDKFHLVKRVSDGKTFLEPLSFRQLLNSTDVLSFDAVEVVDEGEYGTKRNDSASELTLTKVNPRNSVMAV